MTKISIDQLTENSSGKTFGDLDIGDVFEFVLYDCYSGGFQCIKTGYETLLILKSGEGKCLTLLERDQKREIREAKTIHFKIEY